MAGVHTLNTIQIDARPEAVFELAANILDWPKALPHYRWVKQVGREGGDPVFEMAAVRTGIPVKWTSVQTLDRQALRIYYRHVGGATRGMRVEWAIVPRAGGGCDASIIHEMSLLHPVVRSWPGKLITAKLFVTHIADKTLAHIKRAAEVNQCTAER